MILYTNGCSFVWGDELRDRKNEAFPFLLQKKFNCQLIDDSQCGSNNQRILRTTLQQNFKKDIFVIIGWSSIYRYEYYENGWNNVAPHHGEKFKVIKYFKEEWFIVNFLNQVLALQNHLKYHNIPFFFFLSFAGAPVFGVKDYGYDERNATFPNKPIVDWVDYYGEFFDLVDRETFPSLFNNDLVFRDYCFNHGEGMSHDINGHPTKESHKLWADYLYKNINITK
tara:strand:+ start:3589 stop:4263 length:675 start_codon:yes stop_codon:yes gene_type:complete